MKKLLILLSALLFSLNGWTQEPADSKKLTEMCQDFIELKRTGDSGYCMAYFIEYYRKNNRYWDVERIEMSQKERFWWDTIFPCKINKEIEHQISIEGGMVEKFIELVNKNTFFEKAVPLEILMHTYKDEC